MITFGRCTAGITISGTIVVGKIRRNVIHTSALRYYAMSHCFLLVLRSYLVLYGEQDITTYAKGPQLYLDGTRRLDIRDMVREDSRHLRDRHTELRLLELDLA